MSLCLSYRVNLGLSLRKTAQAMKDIHGISISHQMVANYCKTAAVCIKPFVDTYPYEKGSSFVADETYIKVRGIKGYIWLIINAATRAVIGYQVSDNRGVGPCIMAMRMPIVVIVASSRATTMYSISPALTSFSTSTAAICVPGPT